MGGRRGGLGQGPERVSVRKCWDLSVEWAFLYFPRKAVQASMCSSGQLTGGPARCGSQTEGAGIAIWRETFVLLVQRP